MDNKIFTYKQLFSILIGGLKSTYITICIVDAQCPDRNFSEDQLALLHESNGRKKALGIIYTTLILVRDYYGNIEHLVSNEEELKSLFNDIEKRLNKLFDEMESK